MLRIVLAFVDIALHRRGPDHLPASTFLLVLVLASFAAISFLTLQFAALSSGERLVMLLIDAAFYSAYSWSVLKAFSRERRWRQTATALFGAEALLSAVALPVLLWRQELLAAGASSTWPEILIWLIVIWSIDVAGFVLARALGRPYFLGVALMVGYLLLSVNLRASLFPAAV